MESPNADQRTRLLQEIRDLQRAQLERQEEALALQREHFELAKTQYARAEAINEQAEKIQAKSAALIDRSRQLFKIVVPVLLVAIAVVIWLLFQFFI